MQKDKKENAGSQSCDIVLDCDITYLNFGKWRERNTRKSFSFKIDEQAHVFDVVCLLQKIIQTDLNTEDVTNPSGKYRIQRRQLFTELKYSRGRHCKIQELPFEEFEPKVFTCKFGRKKCIVKILGRNISSLKFVYNLPLFWMPDLSLIYEKLGLN